MSEASYEIRFSGETVDGADLAEVKSRMATMFKVDPTRIERLFSGRTVIIKRGLDPEAAIKYRAALHRAGAIVALVASTDTPAAAEPGPSTPATTAADLSLAAPGVLLVEPSPRVTANINVDDLSLARPGVDLTEPRPVAEPEIDIEDLTLAPAGIDLIAPGERAAPDIDTSQLSVAPAGERLTEPRPRPKAEIDTSGLDTID